MAAVEHAGGGAGVDGAVDERRDHAPALRDPQVLFVCEHNAGRSQMAAALLTAFSGGRVGVCSAGHTPSVRIDDHVFDAPGVEERLMSRLRQA